MAPNEQTSADAISAEIEQLGGLSETSEGRDFRSFWERVRAVTELLGQARLSPQDSQRLRIRLNAQCEETKRLQVQFGERSRIESQQLRDQLHLLRSNHRILSRIDYASFFNHAREISQLFKSSRAILKQERENLWQEFSALCTDVRSLQDKESARREEHSRLKRKVVEEKIDEAVLALKYVRGREDMTVARQALDQARDRMKDGWQGLGVMEGVTTELFTLNPGNMTRSDRETVWLKWQEANEEWHSQRGILWSRNYSEIRSAAELCLQMARHGEVKGAHAAIKEARRQMQNLWFEKAQFEELRQLLDQAWERADESFKDQVRSRIQRWEEQIDRLEETKEKIEANIEKCEKMKDDARTEEFADQVAGWIEENQDRLQNIEGKIEELDERIRSAKSKSGD